MRQSVVLMGALIAAHLQISIGATGDASTLQATPPQTPEVPVLLSACAPAVQAEVNGTRDAAADQRCDQAFTDFVASVLATPGVRGEDALEQITATAHAVRAGLTNKCVPWLRCLAVIDRRGAEAIDKAKSTYVKWVFDKWRPSRQASPGEIEENAKKQLAWLREQDALDRGVELHRVPKTLRWSPGEAHSSEFLLDGHRVRVVATESFSVLAYIASVDDPLAIRMHFRNASTKPFDILPDTFTLSVLAPQQKLLPYVSPQQIAKQVENAAAWAMVAEALNSASRAIAGTSSTATSGTVTAWSPRGGSAYGTYNGLTTTYDSAANQRLTNENMARIGQAAEAEKLIRLTGALLANTVFGGQEFGGLVHFKREKRATQLLLTVPIGEQIVELPLEPPRR